MEYFVKTTNVLNNYSDTQDWGSVPPIDLGDNTNEIIYRFQDYDLELLQTETAVNEGKEQFVSLDLLILF